MTLLTGATDPSWSSDESQIAFVDPANGVSVADADGTNPQGLGAGLTSTQPTFSEDGLRVAYTKAGDLWSSLADTHGQELHLTTGTALDADPAYSPDGSEIAFARSSGAGYDIWTLDLTSSTLQQVTSAAGDERSPTWSPSGASIVYTESTNGHLFTVPSGGGTPADLNVAGTDPAFSPDGAKIAFIDGAGHLASIPASVSATPTVTTLDSSATFSQPDWQAVAPAPPSSSGPPTNVSYPTINLQFGDAAPVVGHFLSASIGTWGGSFPLSYTYQWKRCAAADPVNGECVAIPGAVFSFYTPSADDAGKRLRVQVTATNAQGCEVAELRGERRRRRDRAEAPLHAADLRRQHGRHAADAHGRHLGRLDADQVHVLLAALQPRGRPRELRRDPGRDARDVHADVAGRRRLDPGLDHGHESGRLGRRRSRTTRSRSWTRPISLRRRRSSPRSPGPQPSGAS